MNRFYSLPMTRLPYPGTLTLAPTTPVDTPGTVYIQFRFLGSTSFAPALMTLTLRHP